VGERLRRAAGSSLGRRAASLGVRGGFPPVGLVLAACSGLSGDGGDADGADANRADLEGSVDLVHPAPFEGTRSELVFSPSRGVYEEPLDVTLTHPSASEVRYTLDGSDPRTS
jgi:hypothetical protein